jgi:hypothetical protein
VPVPVPVSLLAVEVFESRVPCPSDSGDRP